ncbi:MAG: hypothetical protein KKF89_02180, partial [Nanoarchaeota archaeon]|nr:hypothetical protein [Nanoarchaeota archaeon]
MKSKLFLITVITCILILNFGFTSAYVNYYNGDMGLGIPLFEIKEKNIGYPVSLSYQAGIRVDQRSSPVGLGWSVNFPAVSRMVQGLPDGYNGAKVTYFSDPDDDADNTWEEVKYSVGKFLKRLPPGLTISFDPREVIVKNVIAGINAINYQLTKGSRSASFVDYSTLFLKKGNNMRFVDGYFYTLTKDNQDKAHSYARNYLLNEDLFCKGSESDEYKETSQGRLMCDKTVFIPCEVKFSGTGIEAYNSAFERANRYCADKLGMNPLDISDKHAICKSSKQFGFSNETTLSNYVCGINVIKDDGQIKDSYAVHKYAFESVINHSASWNIDREQPDSYIIQMPGLSGVLVPKQSQSVSAFDYRNTISWNLQTASSNMDKIVSIPNSFGIDRFGNSGNNNDITSFEAYDTYGNKYVFSEQE